MNFLYVTSFGMVFEQISSWRVWKRLQRRILSWGYLSSLKESGYEWTFWTSLVQHRPKVCGHLPVLKTMFRNILQHFIPTYRTVHQPIHLSLNVDEYACETGFTQTAGHSSVCIQHLKVGRHIKHKSSLTHMCHVQNKSDGEVPYQWKSAYQILTFPATTLIGIKVSQQVHCYAHITSYSVHGFRLACCYQCYYKQTRSFTRKFVPNCFGKNNF